MKEQRKKIIFSRPKSDQLIFNYLHKIGGVIVVGVYCWSIANSYSYLSRLYALIPFWLLLFGGWGILFKRCAYKITIDLDSNKITFNTFIKNESIVVKISSIKKVTINNHIKFEFNKKRIFYNGLHNKQLVEFLDELLPIEWGPMGKWTYKHINGS